MVIATNRVSLRSAGPALCISTALVLVLLLGGWGAYQDWQADRQTVLRNEVVRVRSHAERTAGRLERQMAELGSTIKLSEVAQDNWLRDHWSRFIPPPDLIYGAVVDDRGIILSHSDPKREGTTLCPDWNASPLPEAGPDVYSTNCRELTDGPAALDIVVPIEYSGQIVGAYHTGVNREWIEQQIDTARRRSVFGWAAVIGGITAVVLLSSISLYQITRRSSLLEDALQNSRAQRLLELNQLMIGLAHEVRNPLNAIRLNLFTADKIFRGEAEVDSEEVSAMLGESVREIERVDSLVTLLLGYARADTFEVTLVDVRNEVLSVAQFLAPSFKTDEIQLEVDVPEGNVCRTQAGRGQVRQVLLNLLNNALDEVPKLTGRIQIRLERRGAFIRLTITDNGSGIDPADRSRLFSPFFSTKEHGTGLGLALVRSLMERCGGSAECARSEPGNCQFQVEWPAYDNEATTGKST
jgi:two-component system sensor histidine kinase HydH